MVTDPLGNCHGSLGNHCSSLLKFSALFWTVLAPRVFCPVDLIKWCSRTPSLCSTYCVFSSEHKYFHLSVVRHGSLECADYSDMFLAVNYSQNSLVHVEIRLPVEHPRIRSSIPVKDKKFYVIQNVRTHSGLHPVFYAAFTGYSVLGDKRILTSSQQSGIWSQIRRHHGCDSTHVTLKTCTKNTWPSQLLLC